MGGRHTYPALPALVGLLSGAVLCLSGALYAQATKEHASAVRNISSASKGKPSSLSPLEIWRKSQTIGADRPMRAQFSLTIWRDGKSFATLAQVAQGAHGSYRMVYEAPPSARGRVVWIHNRNYWQYEPAKNLLTRTELPARDTWSKSLAHQQIERNYRVSLLSDRETVAGRATYLIELKAVSEGKGRQRIWVDRATFKALRVETYYANGTLARLITYSNIAFPARIPDSEMKPALGPNVRRRETPLSTTMPESDSRKMAERARSVGLMAEGPLGFRLERVMVGRVGKKQTLQLIYSDGLETLSVFVQENGAPFRQASAEWRAVPMKQITAYRRVRGHTDTLLWTHRGRRYTVIAHLQPSAMEAFVREQIR
jgi:outer membrane lipoprotein-sorting protein